MHSPAGTSGTVSKLKDPLGSNHLCHGSVIFTRISLLLCLQNYPILASLWTAGFLWRCNPILVGTFCYNINRAPVGEWGIL